MLGHEAVAAHRTERYVHFASTSVKSPSCRALRSVAETITSGLKYRASASPVPAPRTLRTPAAAAHRSDSTPRAPRRAPGTIAAISSRTPGQSASSTLRPTGTRARSDADQIVGRSTGRSYLETALLYTSRKAARALRPSRQQYQRAALAEQLQRASGGHQVGTEHDVDVARAVVVDQGRASTCARCDAPTQRVTARTARPSRSGHPRGCSALVLSRTCSRAASSASSHSSAWRRAFSSPTHRGIGAGLAPATGRRATPASRRSSAALAGPEGSPGPRTGPGSRGERCRELALFRHTGAALPPVPGRASPDARRVLPVCRRRA